jgi:hypothetical protein
MASTLIDIKRIRVDGATQMRVRKHDEAIEEYTEAYIEDKKLPPVQLVYDGTNHWLWDGFHRVDAAKLAGKKAINADIQRGTLRDARALAAGANAENGLRRSTDDKINAIKQLCQDGEFAFESNREIARLCKVSTGFVTKHRGGTVDEVTPGAPAMNGSVTSVHVDKRNKKVAAGAVRVTKPAVKSLGDVSLVIAERDELRDKLADSTAMLEQLVEEMRVLQEGLDLGDIEKALRAEVTALRKKNDDLMDAKNGMQEELNAAIRQVKSWKRRFEKLEKDTSGK